MDLYKMHCSEINIEISLYNYHFGHLIKTKQIRNWRYCNWREMLKRFGHLFHLIWPWKVDKDVESVLLWISLKDWKIWRKKYLMIDDNILNKVLGKNKKIIGNEKLENAKILIETDHKCRCDFTLKNVVILITCFLKNRDKSFILCWNFFSLI